MAVADSGLFGLGVVMVSAVLLLRPGTVGAREHRLTLILTLTLGRVGVNRPVTTLPRVISRSWDLSKASI